MFHDTIQYGSLEIDYLKVADQKLGRRMEEIGFIERICIPDFYEGFVNAVIGQQISSKAMLTIWNRLKVHCGEITVNSVLSLKEEEWKQMGISAKKAGYLKSCAQKINDGLLDPEALFRKQDKEVIRILTDLDGVGVWTAQMIMIFTMGRKDVLSFGDYGIRKGICKLHNLNELTKEQFVQFQNKYSPYGTIASLYLWEIAKE